MTDNEIIKALECCKETVDDIDNESKCCSCSLIQDGWCTSTLAKNALSLINRQKEEISELQHRNSELEIELKAMRVADNFNKTEIDRLQRLGVSATRRMVTARAEAIKEFAERLKGKFDLCGIEYYAYTLADDVAKEMGVGDNADM